MGELTFNEVIKLIVLVEKEIWKLEDRIDQNKSNNKKIANLNRDKEEKEIIKEKLESISVELFKGVKNIEV